MSCIYRLILLRAGAGKFVQVKLGSVITVMRKMLNRFKMNDRCEQEKSTSESEKFGERARS